MQSDRRKFLKRTFASAATMTAIPMLSGGIFDLPLNKSSVYREVIVKPENRRQIKESIRFSVIGLNHGHIYGIADALIKGGGVLVSVYSKEPELLPDFIKRFPQVKIARNEDEIIRDHSIQLVASASIPIDRAPLGIRAMQSGKDFVTDKPGILTLDQLEKVKQVQKETKRIFSIMYSERLGNPASFKAAELIREGAIGKVIQTIGLGPHRMNPSSRPEWFFDPEKAGGILCDIGSHQFDQFLFYTGSKQAEVNFSQVGNFNTTKYPNYQDFGDMSVRSPHATGYIRIDWFTPDGLGTWGDGRTFILGTEGYIEMRKYIDIAGRKGGNHLFLVNRKETVYYDCSNVVAPYGEQLVSDVVNRTETAMTQEHCFLATELALKAQKMAVKLNTSPSSL